MRKFKKAVVFSLRRKQCRRCEGCIQDPAGWSLEERKGVLTYSRGLERARSERGNEADAHQKGFPCERSCLSVDFPSPQRSE